MKIEPTEPELARDIGGVAALNEPVRRALYLYVTQQERSVSRDAAAQAVGISRPLAAFHLDKLVEEGLLDVSYRRLNGRVGPGAGRPAKLYRRSRREIEVTLPPRRYELAARLLAQTLAQGDSPATRRALDQVARSFGASLAAEARARCRPGASPDELLDAARAVLVPYGFEPRRGPGMAMSLRNCPFHALSAQHPHLICGMNLKVFQGLLAGLKIGGVEAVLEPRPNACCVALRDTNPAG